MAHLYTYTDQTSPSLTEDGDWDSVRANREQALQVNTREGMVDQWTRDGRVFIANAPVLGQAETMSANGTEITLTAPSLRYTVPSGVTVVPISVVVACTAINAKIESFAVIVNNADSYTSGGDAVAMLCKNAILNGTTEARTTGVTNLHYSDTAIVEAGLTNPRLLKYRRQMGTGTDETSCNPEYNILKGDPMVYLVGPASFLVFMVEETAAVEATWTLTWAELQASTVP